jgi:hypothetical protein
MRAFRATFLLLTAGLALGAALLSAREVRAETIDVPCAEPALVAALAAANSNGREDFLWLAPSCAYELPATGTVAMDAGDPIWVFGRGASLSGGHQRTVLQVNAWATLHLHDVTVTAGRAADDGGAIVNRGKLTLTRSTVSSSTSQDWGGGIYNEGTLRLTRSTVWGNASTTSGGGIYNAESGRLTLEDSSVGGNSSLYGGGVRNGHRAAFFNSTLLDNEASLGGAFLNEAQARATLSSVTLSHNAASIPGGGGGLRNTALLVLENSIVANSRAGGDCYSSGFLLPSGANLVEDGSCAIAGALSGDPLFADVSLAEAPRFLPLLLGSPAIDAGSAAACPGADQLGTARPRDGDDDGTAACDLGASEYACGLLGIEPLLVLPFARRLARARRRRPARG